MTSLDLISLDTLWRIVLSMLRIGVALALIPVFSTQRLTAVGVAALAAATSLPVAVSQLAAPSIGTSALGLLGLFLHEAALGVLIGLGFGAFCGGIQTAGDLIDRQTGLTFSQSVDPVQGNNVSVTTIALEQVVFAVLVASGFILSIVDTLYFSFRVWPVRAALPHIGELAVFGAANATAGVFSLALLLSGPVVLVLFVVDVALGLLNRAAPTLNVFNLAITMKSLVGLAVVAAALPLILERVLSAAQVAAASLRALMTTGG